MHLISRLPEWLELNFYIFFNSPLHADYENDLKTIPRTFLGQDIYQTMWWSQNKNYFFDRGLWSWWLPSVDEHCPFWVVTNFFWVHHFLSKKRQHHTREFTNQILWSPPTKDMYLPQRVIINIKTSVKMINLFLTPPHSLLNILV